MSAGTVGVEPLARVLRQLADGVACGLAPADVLQLTRQASTAAADCGPLLDALGQASSAARPWADALRGFPQHFPPEAVDLVQRGEQDGGLGPTLLLLADEFEARSALRQSIRGALAWPAFIGLWLVLIVAVIMIFVVPAFREVFASFGADLPAPTLLLIAVSDFFVGWWWLLLAALAGLYGLFKAGRLAGLVALLSPGLVRLPAVGPFLTLAFGLRVARLLVPVIDGQLPAPTVLAYLRATAGQTLFARQAQALEAAVAAGTPVADALHRCLPDSGDIALALHYGQRSGGSGDALRHALAHADNALQRRRMRLQQMLMAVFYLLAGLLVGGFVVSLYLPIFKLGSVV